MTDHIQQGAAMPLAGYHHLPKVPVMGRNVRTAQSKSSVKMSFEAQPDNKDTMLHVDGSSKIVKLLTGDELIENVTSHNCKSMNGPTMTNGLDVCKSNSDDAQLETIDCSDRNVDSFPAVQKKRGRKKKIRESEGQSVTGPAFEANNSMNTSDLNASLKETKEIAGDSKLVDSPVVMQKKRGRKKKNESLPVDNSLSESVIVNQSLETFDFNASQKESSYSVASDHVPVRAMKSNEVHSKALDNSYGTDKSIVSPSEPKKRGRKKKIKNNESMLEGTHVLDSCADNQPLKTSHLSESLNVTNRDIHSDNVLDSLDESISGSNGQDNVLVVTPVKKKRGRKKKIITGEDLSGKSLLSEQISRNQSMNISESNASSKEIVETIDPSQILNSPDEQDGEKHSLGKRKRVSQSFPKEKVSMSASSQSSEMIRKKKDCDDSHSAQPETNDQLPRCVLIMPADVPTEIQLEKLKAMESSSYDLHHPHFMGEGYMFWARVSGHPYWPCMISKCPFTKMISRIKGDVKVSRSYHVQFFGNACERGWINEPSLMPFKGKADFLEKARLESLKSKSTKKGRSSYNPYKLKSARIPEWTIAVEEAEKAFSMSMKDRYVQYTFDYVFIDDVKKLKENTPRASLPSASSTPLANGKRKRKDSPSRLSEVQPKLKRQKLDKSKSPLVIDVPKEESSFDAYYAKHYSSVMEHHPDWDTSLISKYLQQQWSTVSPKSSRQSKISQDLSTCLISPVFPDGEKRLKKPSKKIVESLLQGQEHCLTENEVPKVSPPQPRKRGRPRKITAVEPTAEDPLLNVNSGAEEKVDINIPEPKPKASTGGASIIARKMSQDSDSGSEGKKHTKEPYELEIFKLLMTSRIEKENICSICEKSGDLKECIGTCGQYFHPGCLNLINPSSIGYKCDECTSGIHSCFSCKVCDISTKKCSVSQCGKYYHDECLRKLRFARVISESKGFVCPLHTCATCAVDNIRNPKATKGRLYRCIRCPVAYHFGDFCLAAGSENLGGAYIVCSDHFQRKKSFSQHTHVNITWCFSCSKGGSLLCCDNCPASYHAECVKVEKTPDEAWFCEDCVAGKKLLYGSIVWVKIGNYRWWPGEICHPRHVPLNIQDKTHHIGEFPVRFFGSHDYYWIHRGRVFLFEEGDKASRDSSSKGLFKVYMRGVQEATEAFKLWKAAKAKKEEQEQERNDKKPSQFRFTKNNVPIGNVQIYKAELSEIPHCECTQDQEEPCGSDCLNRMMMYECHPGVCPAKEKCNNQRFQKRQHAQCEPFRAEGRGWGLRTLQDLKKGQFVIEYVGDLIDEEECKRRIQMSHEDNVTNFYMLTMDKNRIIDAGPKGNYSRFMNHSCCPNIETQKWTVNGDIRVGLFALCDIPIGTELVFNYNLECLGNEKTACACGSENCSGFLGVRPKTAAAIANEKKVKELKKKHKKKKLDTKKEYEDDCFRCGEGGELVMCDRLKCPKVYHLQCLNLTKPPSGKWACPWHHCDECGKSATNLCYECPNSFCAIHAPGNIQDVAGCQVCTDHTELLDNFSNCLEEESTSLKEKDVGSSKSSFPKSETERLCESTIKPCSAILNGEMTDESTVQDPLVSEPPTAKVSAQKDMVSSSKQSNNLPNGTRQPGLSRKGRTTGFIEKCRTKAKYKARLSSPTIMQSAISIQDSDDNDSISDLVIDIP